MKPSYIILTETGERLDLNQANEFNPNEYTWGLNIGLYCDPDHLNESYCYTPDLIDDDEPTTATTLGFRAYDSAGNLICQGDGGCGIWL